MDVLHQWPWLALGIGLVGVALLLRPRPSGSPPRWEDPRWILAAGLPIYMLHQFEEHGVDLLGRAYAFQASFCATLGHADVATCPADPSFMMAVNVGAVWIAFASGMIVGPRRAMVGATALGIPLVSAFMHVVPAIVTRSYNPGVATAALLLAPLAFLGLRGLLRTGHLDRARVAAVVAFGLVVHGALIGSVTAYTRGLLSHGGLLAIQLALGFLPLAIGLALGDARRRP
ncbi:MAG: HXXEE domain-containing protein [Nannocystaceae bacterium]